MAAGRAAPGTAIAPTESTTQYSATSDADPLAPKATQTGKHRYSERAKTEAATKAAKKDAKVADKAAATPTPVTADEKATLAQQAAPLGLNGDTAKKKKKVKVKGAPKARLQGKEKPTAVKPEPMPLSTDKPVGTGTAPSADRTTLPPANAPGPETNPPSTTPATPGAPIPTPPPN